MCYEVHLKKIHDSWFSWLLQISSKNGKNVLNTEKAGKLNKIKQYN